LARKTKLQVAILLLCLIASGCSTGKSNSATRHPLPRSTTTSPPTTSTVVTTTAAPTTSPAPTFPSVVSQAMAQFVPLPAGAEAPIRLPQVSGYLTAETGGLGGQDNVTLIVTSSPVPVNSPTLTSSGGTELAAFTNIATASDSNADSQLAQAKSQSIDSCGGASQALTLADGTAATSCPTLDGEAVNWTFDGWTVQVVTLSGSTPSVGEADQADSTLHSAGVPTSSGAGIVSVVVPANSSVGQSDTSALEWVLGPNVYQVHSSDNPVAAIDVAAQMRPYPTG